MRPIDTVNEKQGQNQVKTISVTGEARVETDSGIEKVEGPAMDDLAKLERFMNEELEVFVYEPMEDGEERVVELGVNGVKQFVIRGVPQKIKRKYVERLCRAKRAIVSANGQIDPGTMEAKNNVRISRSLQYPFTVQFDPNPEGPAWLRRVLQEA